MNRLLLLITDLLIWNGGLISVDCTEVPTIFSIDFENFTYPNLDPDTEWPEFITLTDGHCQYAWDEARELLTPGVDLDDIQYVLFQGYDNPMAIVILHVNMGGTASYHYVYFVAMTDDTHCLVAAFSGGDRIIGGLKRVYESDGYLVTELYSPLEAPCMIEARYYVRTWYEWQDDAFQQVGETEILPVEPGQEQYQGNQWQKRVTSDNTTAG